MKRKKKSGEVRKYDIYFSFTNCYLHVKENLKDSSVIVSQEKGQKIFNRIKELFDDYDFGRVLELVIWRCCIQRFQD